MPHLTVEYSNNLPALSPAALLGQLNQVLVESGHFTEVDIKSRALGFDTFAVGTAPAPRAFVHAKLALLSGRTEQTKAALSAQLLAVLQSACHAPAGVQLQLCAEIQDIDRASYAKATHNLSP